MTLLENIPAPTQLLNNHSKDVILLPQVINSMQMSFSATAAFDKKPSELRFQQHANLYNRIYGIHVLSCLCLMHISNCVITTKGKQSRLQKHEQIEYKLKIQIHACADMVI